MNKSSVKIVLIIVVITTVVLLSKWSDLWEAFSSNIIVLEMLLPFVFLFVILGIFSAVKPGHFLSVKVDNLLTTTSIILAVLFEYLVHIMKIKQSTLR